MVGLQTLDLAIGVRVPASQPTFHPGSERPLWPLVPFMQSHFPGLSLSNSCVSDTTIVTRSDAMRVWKLCILDPVPIAPGNDFIAAGET